MSKKKKEEKFPTIRVRRLANEHVNAVVEALKAKGMDVSKTSLVSDMMLAIPMPAKEVQELTAPTKRRIRKAAETVAVSVAATAA